MPNQTKDIQISYESQTGWPYPLLNAIQAHPDSLVLMNRYRSANIGDRLISLSTKIVVMGIVVQRLNQSLQQINNEMEIEREHLANCITNGYAYVCKDRMLPFQLVLDSETFIFEARSSFDMRVEFADLLHSTYSIFSSSITKANIAKFLAKSNSKTDWIDELKTIRDFGIHEKAPWIGIIANKDAKNTSPVIVFDDTHNAPISTACYTIDTLKEISKGISDLFALIMHEAVNKITGGN